MTVVVLASDEVDPVKPSIREMLDVMDKVTMVARILVNVVTANGQVVDDDNLSCKTLVVGIALDPSVPYMG